MGATRTSMQQLELVREAKIFDILPGSPDPRLEASGVLALDGLFYVIGNLAPSGWQVIGAGTSYALPRASDGGIVYETLEGVSWVAPDHVVMVSDKAKPQQDHRWRAKDQSIHIFRIPSPVYPVSATPPGPSFTPPPSPKQGPDQLGRRRLRPAPLHPELTNYG